DARTGRALVVADREEGLAAEAPRHVDGSVRPDEAVSGRPLAGAGDAEVAGPARVGNEGRIARRRERLATVERLRAVGGERGDAGDCRDRAEIDDVGIALRLGPA